MLKEIYLIYARQFDVCKVGISKSSKSRLKNIQTGCPVEVEVRSVFVSKYPHKVERILHRNFKKYKIEEITGIGKLTGEWFALPLSEILNFLESCRKIESMIDMLKSSGNPFV